MNRKIGLEWVSRLRSGRYQQGKGRLRGGDKFCCLGVLCEIAFENGVITTMTRPALDTDGNDIEITAYGDGEYFETSYLPDDVERWAGLRSDNPTVRVRDGLYDLAWLNDHGYTFDNVADLIEAQLLDPEPEPETEPEAA